MSQIPASTQIRTTREITYLKRSGNQRNEGEARIPTINPVIATVQRQIIQPERDSQLFKQSVKWAQAGVDGKEKRDQRDHRVSVER